MDRVLKRRRVVERSFVWLARFRRLARDYERLLETLKGLHLLAFAVLMLRRFVTLMAEYAEQALVLKLPFPGQLDASGASSTARMRLQVPSRCQRA